VYLCITGPERSAGDGSTHSKTALGIADGKYYITINSISHTIHTTAALSARLLEQKCTGY
jgi:hypothetical protein